MSESDSGSDSDNECDALGASSGVSLTYAGGDWLAAPTRADFVDAAGAGPSTVYFMPVDVEDSNEYAGGLPTYVLRIYGALADGSKAEVTVTGIRVFFDVQVPDGVAPAAVEARLRGLIAAAGAAAALSFETVRAFPDRGYRREPAAFIRVVTANLQQRRAAFEAVRGASVGAGAGADETRLGETRLLETKSDDRSAYYRKAARELGLPLSDWAVLSLYEHEAGPTARSPLCAHVFRVAAAGYRPLVDPFAEIGRASGRERV